MSTKVSRSILVFGLLLLSARPCLAQTKPAAEIPAAATFDRLPDVAKVGAKVVVTDVKGQAVIGKVGSITTDALHIKIPGWGSKTYDVKRDDIQTVRKKADSSMNGALIGIAAGLGGAVGIAYMGLPDDGYAGFLLLGLIPAGGAAGYYIDRAISDRRLLYAKPSGPKVSFERALGGNVGVRADVGLVSPSNHRPAPRVAASLVMSFGSRRNP